MSRLTTLALGAAGVSLLIPPVAAGQFYVAIDPKATTATLPDKATEYLRAVRDVSADLVRSIAEGAAATQFDPGNFPDLRTFTARRVIKVKCGSVRKEYWDVLKNSNGVSLGLDEPLGERAYSIRWPACLYVSAETTARVLPGENAFKIYERLIGDKPSKSMVLDYYGVASLKQIASLTPGDMLAVKRVSLPSPITPLTQSLRVQISTLLDRSASFSDPMIKPAAVPATSTRGPEMVIAAGYVASTGVIDPPKECDGATMPDARALKRVARAYEWSRNRLADLQRSRVPVEVMVVDNGFLGGRETPAGFAANPLFPANHYSVYSGGGPGPILFEGKVPPWIEPPTPFSAVAGHGTHVAMLALGGPDFIPDVDRLTADGNNTFLRLSVLNVGNGKDVLLPASSEQLRTLLGFSAFRVVNMSIEYQDDAEEQVREHFRYIFTDQDNANKLFVVAAGNDGQPAADRFPAAFGGESRSNVIAVGAVRPDNTLARFSNWGPKVDFAAPGCGVSSIIDDHYRRAPLSGTSQAAPQVSFLAALLRTLGGLSAGEIKTRLLVSGSLLSVPDPNDPAAGRPPSAVVSRSRLDAERALYLFDDYLELLDGRRYLGQINEVDGVTCDTDMGKMPESIDSLWAFKHDLKQGWVFPGRAAATFQTPCKWTPGKGATLIFTPTQTIGDDGPQPVPAGTGPLTLSFEAVGYLVARHKLQSI